MTLPELSSAADLFRANANSVLFVTSQLRPRELKMADGLRRLGWTVGLIYYKWTPFDPREYFDFCIVAGSCDEAHSIAKKLFPRVTHVFSGAIDDMVLQFCRQKPSPVVIDLNDVFAPSLFDYCHERFEPTREALALADGFCARDLQVKSAEHVDNFQLPPQLILFPEYCWNTTPIQQEAEKRVQSNDIHVVSVGTFSLESQGMYDSCYLRLAELLIEQEIHFHIYPHWAYRRDHTGSPHANFEKDFADFLALEKASQYLHVHDSMPIEELAKVLPQYDFGIVSGGCAQFGQKLGFYYPAYLETCYSGRISDYLDARLPVLINDEVKFDYWLLKRYGICIDLKGVLQPGFKQSLLDLKRNARQRETMEHAAQKLSVDYNSPRLASFYRKVITAGILNENSKKPSETALAKYNEPSAETSKLTGSAEIGTRTARNKRLITTLKEGYRWLAPRSTKIILPYRAIRLFEAQLHNALQKNASTHAAIATLHAQVTGLEQDKAAALSHVAGLEQDKAEFRTHIASLEQDKITLHAQVTGLEQDKAAALSHVAGLEQDKAEFRTHIASLEQDKVTLHVQVTGLEQNKAAALSHVAGLEQDKAALHAQVAALESDNKELSTRNASLLVDLCDFTDRTERDQLATAAHQMIDKICNLEKLGTIDNEPKLLLACMPKSGSTWLTSLLEDKLELPPLRCCLEADRNEQELDSTVLFKSWGRRVLFVQQHIRYSRIMMRLCHAFSTKIVVLTRRLDDIVVSLRDHIEHESPEFSMFYMEAEWFKNKSPDEQIDFIIDHAMPWYLNFFVGWQRAGQNNKVDILQVRYEDLIQDTAMCVERIASFYGAPVQYMPSFKTDKRIETRFNQGRVGRGKEVLSKEQQARLRKLADYYPDCDFESVGL